jgi:hypothetical protein
LKQRQNVIIIGKTGVGKSYLACALAHKACRLGFSVLYQRASRFVRGVANRACWRQLRQDAGQSGKTQLLVLDDFGLEALTADQRRELLEVIEDRYQSSSTLITSQVPVDHWHELIGDPTIADAILDRMVHNAHKLSLRGESRRKSKSKEPQWYQIQCHESRAAWQVIDFTEQTVRFPPNKAFDLTEIHNVLSANFRAAERLAPANIEKLKLIFSYRESNRFVLIDVDGAESIEVDANDFGSNVDLLKEGLENIIATMHRGKVIRVDLPNTVDLAVQETPPEERGNTTSGGGKQATLETGAKINVPFHVKVGDTVRVDTRTREYITRLSQWLLAQYSHSTVYGAAISAIRRREICSVILPFSDAQWYQIQCAW